MNDKKAQKSFSYFPKKMKSIFVNECFSGISNRIKDRLQPNFLQIHLFILTTQIDAISQNLGRSEAFGDAGLARSGRTLRELEFMQVTLNDDQIIDELTEIDEWHISKNVSLEKLKEGWNCFILKREGQIVTTGWVFSGQSFYEPHLKRESKLAENEAYHWRGYTVPGFRGKGFLPWYTKILLSNLAESGITHNLAIVRAENKTMQRSLAKVGWSKVGRTGFYEIFGVRFHYLLGRKAFSATKKRIFIQRHK